MSCFQFVDLGVWWKRQNIWNLMTTATNLEAQLQQ